MHVCVQLLVKNRRIVKGFLYMQNDKLITISVGASRKSTVWLPQTMLWSDFVMKLQKPVKSQETLADYKKMPKAKQDDLKDIGGFVGGSLQNNRRGNHTVIDRTIITLDADNIPPGETQKIVNTVSALNCAYAIYSTRKHESAKPRLRILFPTDRPITADEYQPIARKIASFIGMDYFDPTTFEPSRLMYWPSCCADGEYAFAYEDKPWVSADGLLHMYADWTNCAEWPVVPSAQKVYSSLAKKQSDPTTKVGVVGAFCRTYSIEEAMDEFLPEVYTPCDTAPGRYTFVGGSTVGGAVLYEDGNFLFSHHGTDPCSGKLVNAFDLVRYHKFSELDYDAKVDTPTVQMPSYKAMLEFAVADEIVATLLNKERYENAVSDFTNIDLPTSDNSTPLIGNTPDDLDWVDKLKISGTTAMPVKTVDNVLIILEHDPMLKGKIAYDEFANRPVALSSLPWRKVEGEHTWNDTDDAGLRHYIEKLYGISGKDRIADAFSLCAEKNRFHRIKDYLTSLQWDGTKRLDRLFIDYFGSADTVYTRAVTRKSFVAAVARAMQPGVKFDTMAVITGKQGIGKSTLLKKMGKQWHNDSISVFKGKEAPEQIQGYWIIELGELAGFNKSETNDVKQFLSRTEDVYREPYGRRTVNNKRQCVFFGTTNDSEYLKDSTGNRRFWPIDTGIIQPTKSVFKDLDDEVDMLWAEAYLYWQLGEHLYLEGDANKEAELQQENHMVVSPKEGVIREFLERGLPADWSKRNLQQRRLYWSGEFAHAEGIVDRQRVCAAEIWCECFNGDIGKMPRAETVEINSILNKLDGWQRVDKTMKFGGIYGAQRGFIKG